MKHIILLIAILFVGCSKEPKEMEAVLFERSGQWITNDDYSDFFFFNRKVYNGPAYMLHRNGQKKEEGTLKNGYKSGTWTGWDKEGNKKYSGPYEYGMEQGSWTGFHINGKKKYEGDFDKGFQIGKWTYYNDQGKKNLEEIYFVCDEKCEEEHSPRECHRKGKVKQSKEF